MEGKIKNYVEALFADAPKTKKAIELRQEIYTNLLDKYNDLIASGAAPDEAYEIVKKSIGNVDELIRGLYETSSDESDVDEEIRKKKTAKFNAISVMLYILSPIFIIIFWTLSTPQLNLTVIGVVLFFVSIAVATGLLVYCNMMYPKYKKIDDTVVEEFKEWQAESKNKKERKYKYSGVFWLLIVILYFIISFTTGAWFITWILFLIGAAIEQIIKITINN